MGWRVGKVAMNMYCAWGWWVLWWGGRCCCGLLCYVGWSREAIPKDPLSRIVEEWSISCIEFVSGKSLVLNFLVFKIIFSEQNLCQSKPCLFSDTFHVIAPSCSLLQGGCLLSVSQATMSAVFWLSLGGTGEKLSGRMGEREEHYSLSLSLSAAAFPPWF